MTTGRINQVTTLAADANDKDRLPVIPSPTPIIR